MRTIETIKEQQYTGESINKYSVCFRVDHLWEESLRRTSDCNSFFSFLIVCEGTMEQKVNYQTIQLRPYDLLITTPGQLVETVSASDDFSGYYLAIDEKQYNGMMASDSAYAHLTLFYTAHQIPLIHCPKVGGDVVIGLMDQLSHLMKCAYTNVYIDKMMMLVEESLMLQLINVLPQNYENPVKLSHQEEVFRNFIELLSANYRKHHDSKFYSDGLNFSNSYLARILKAIAGQSVKEFIADMLVKDASSMLRFTDIPITQISDELGFTDGTAFSKFFKQHLGKSPIDFRKEEYGKK